MGETFETCEFNTSKEWPIVRLCGRRAVVIMCHGSRETRFCQRHYDRAHAMVEGSGVQSKYHWEEI